MTANKKHTEVDVLSVHTILNLFGGKYQIVHDYEKLLGKILTTKGVEKWAERKNIPTAHLLNLKAISKEKGINFNIEDYIG